MPEPINGSNSLLLLLQPDCVLNACSRTLDTAAAAAGIALDAAQKVSKRQFDLAQQTAAAFTSSVQTLGKAASPVEAIGSQAEFLRASCEQAFAGTSEVAAILRQSGEATLALLEKRLTEAMDGFGRKAGTV